MACDCITQCIHVSSEAVISVLFYGILNNILCMAVLGILWALP